MDYLIIGYIAWDDQTQKPKRTPGGGPGRIWDSRARAQTWGGGARVVPVFAFRHDMAPPA